MTIRRFILLFSVFLMATPVAAQDRKPKDALTIAISSDFQPFTFLSPEGKPAGMFVDFWRLWSKKTGKAIQFISSDWKTSIENIKAGKAAIHSGLFSSPKRLDWLATSQPFYEAGVGLFFHVRQGKISNIDQLSGQTIAAILGAQPEEFLKSNYPNIDVLPCKTIEELARTCNEGKARGFVSIIPLGRALIDRMGLSGEFEAYDKVFYREGFRAGVLKENTELLGLVNEGFQAISSSELAEIEARWISDPAKRYFKAARAIPLTPLEKAWIKSHQTIKVGMAVVVPPLKFLEKGVVKGIEPDYLQLLSEYTGLNFEYVVDDFSVMDEKAKSGEIDMFISFYIPDRLSYMSFTEPLMDFKQVIIARKDAPFMSGIGALNGKRVAVLKGVRLHEKLLNPYPDIQVVPENTMEDMFKAVSDSRADALISKTYYAAYILHKYPDLKIAGVLDLPPEPYLYAVRKDHPELVSILNKAIAAIPREVHEAIVQKWFSVRLEYRPNWYEILKWASAVVGVLLVILVLTLFWNRRMAGEIEKRKETERTLRETEEELRAEKEFADKLLDAPADTVFVFNPFTGKAIRWNKVFSLVCGYSDEEIASLKAPDAYYGKTDLERARTAIARMLKEGEGTIELSLTTKDGKLIPFEYSGSLVADRDGVPRLLISIGRDITERRRAEEERLQLERQLQEARKAESLGRMAAAIAHHLNNLLGVVTGNLELAMLDLPRGSKPRSNITDAMAASWRAADVGRSMLAYLGQSVGTRAPIGLAEICREALPTLTASLPKKVRLKTEFPNDGPIIHADAVQVRQILTNLVVNAGESIGAGEGEVVVAIHVIPAADIRASKLYPSDWEPQHDSYACLEVSDTGAGMDQETLERIFEPFFSTKFTGRGLGLAIVLGSVKAQEGVVIVESTPGRGSVFRVFLPVVGQKVGPPGKQGLAETVTAGDRGLVLLVDDEPALRRMAQTMLKRLDYEVITAADGLEALEVFRKQQDRVRCVLLDLTMPGMDGWETLDELRALRPGLPVVLASGYNKTQVMAGYHAELPQAFLHKPYEMKELESALDTAMRTPIDAKKG